MNVYFRLNSPDVGMRGRYERLPAELLSVLRGCWVPCLAVERLMLAGEGTDQLKSMAAWPCAQQQDSNRQGAT